jgi:hypothetical protein
LGLPRFWRRIIFFVDLRLKWGSNQSCSPHRNLSNCMWHATYTQVNQSDYWLLMVRSQIGSLIPDLSFGNNLCSKYPNGSCEPILNILVPRSFRWYKKLFNIMSFDPCNRPLKIWESIGIPTPRVRAHLGVWGFIPSHFPTFPRAWNLIPGLYFWLTPLQALALVTSPRLGLRHFHCSYSWFVSSKMSTLFFWMR